ncbi:hypothetical protein BDF20DRAFT_840458 [Mycotypha africana]|uniref:uncharacterized protein n=1 Tax=Mycotypha africana TaxID=64632 RepID=UPI0023001B3E|nr:uncharacterized protein BDF20DRAFT_840458 [Mycotypha africana]KAI8967197.1 hypothetical protein BDF20DRAFT_840458 [Mycotypha africana]
MSVIHRNIETLHLREPAFIKASADLVLYAQPRIERLSEANLETSAYLCSSRLGKPTSRTCTGSNIPTTTYPTPLKKDEQNLKGKFVNHLKKNEIIADSIEAVKTFTRTIELATKNHSKIFPKGRLLLQSVRAQAWSKLAMKYCENEDALLPILCKKKGYLSRTVYSSTIYFSMINHGKP